MEECSVQLWSASSPASFVLVPASTSPLPSGCLPSRRIPEVFSVIIPSVPAETVAFQNLSKCRSLKPVSDLELPVFLRRSWGGYDHYNRFGNPPFMFNMSRDVNFPIPPASSSTCTSINSASNLLAFHCKTSWLTSPSFLP